MDLQKEREAFERHKFKDQYDELKAYYDDHECEHGYRYPSYTYDDEWETWQAAKAQAVPDGYVLAPKEPTEKMIRAGRDERRDSGTVASTYKAMIEAVQESTDD